MQGYERIKLWNAVTDWSAGEWREGKPEIREKSDICWVPRRTRGGLMRPLLRSRILGNAESRRNPPSSSPRHTVEEVLCGARITRMQ